MIFKHRGSGPPSTLATSSINVVCQEMKTALVYGLEDAISKEMAFLFVLNMQQPWKYKEPNLNSIASHFLWTSYSVQKSDSTLYETRLKI